MSKDLLCMGRAAVDLYAEQIGAPLDEAASFAKYVGGCPANIAIGASRLGLKTGILSRVGKEAMGRFVRHTFQQEGVDTSCLHTDPDRLTGLVLLGVDPPDRFPLIFYRENCADMALTTSDFSPETFRDTRALLITGTHCSKAQIFEVTKEASRLAKESGAKLILDIDYRPVLWGVTGHESGEERYVVDHTVSERLSQLLPWCDLIVGTEEEIRVAANRDDLTEALEVLRSLTEATIVRKRGEQGCVVYSKNIAKPITGRPFPVKVLNVLGAGDAFMSGFLRGYLRGCSLEECCNLANANGALVVTRHGCAPAMPYWDELQHFMEHPRDLAQVEHLHFRIQKATRVQNLYLLACDHRAYFAQVSPQKVCDFKTLVYKGLQKVSQEFSRATLGIIVDAQYGGKVLRQAAKDGFFTAQCIEEPSGTTLNFLGNQEAASILRLWPPNQVVKVLCRITGDPLPIDKLTMLYAATKAYRRSLLIEFVNTLNPNDLQPIHEAIDACYTAKIFPDWWKLPPIDHATVWNQITRTVAHYDPYCQGILLLGADQTVEELSTLFGKIRRQHPMIKGFAVGRAIWGNAAQRWLQGTVTDQEVVDCIANNLRQLIEVSQDRRDTDDRYTRDARDTNPNAYHGASPYFVPDSAKSRTF